MDKVDVLIVGAGHNGLTCAAYLAAAGLRVRVAEMRPAVGGAAVTEEFVPGFRNSTASYTVSLLNPKVIRDLRLAERGLRIVERPFSNFVPLPDGRHLKFGGDPAATQAEVARFSAVDAQTLPRYYAQLDRVGVDVQRPVDMDGVARVEQAIREGWLLHFPAGTTKKGAPLRSGVSRLLHSTKAVALPVRVDGFREMLLHKQVPGKLFKRCSLRIHPPLDLDDFYAQPYHKDDGARLLRHLEDLLGDKDEA